MTNSQIVLVIYAAFLVLASLLAFMLYSKDKKMAVKNGGPKRIKEKTLLSVAACGGAIGAFLGRIICHHKTDKKYFSMVIYFSLLLQLAVLALAVLFAVEVF